MAQDIFIGVDGGGTKTTVRIEDARGQLLGSATGGPANVRISVDGAWRSIEQAMADALKASGIALSDKQYHFHVGMGLAGLEIVAAGKAFSARPHGFATLILSTDAHTACLGAHLGADGAIIIVGTGVVGYQIQGEHNSKVGGWGFPNDDEGSGAWMGLEAVRHTFQMIDGRSKKTALATAVFQFFENDLEKLSCWVDTANSTEYAQLAPLVIQHAEKRDAIALDILQQAARAIDVVAIALEKHQTQRDIPLPCALVGGIAPFVAPLLSDKQQARLVNCQQDPSAGAILLVKSHVNE